MLVNNLSSGFSCLVIFAIGFNEEIDEGCRWTACTVLGTDDREKTIRTPTKFSFMFKVSFFLYSFDNLSRSLLGRDHEEV
mmetsp:Transcript_22667/g.34254  ORF Transcript_22667/g.34254 Transcript_22667/m.34254 type:complete len:80 (+) Transcript_22667:1345-1584(+)